MERITQDEYRVRTSQHVLFHQDDLAALIQELGEHYILDQIRVAGWTLRSLDEVPGLIAQLKQDQRPLQVQNLTAAFQHKNQEGTIVIQFHPKGVDFQASRNTPFEAGVWLRIAEWIKRRAPSRRMELWNALIGLLAVLMFATAVGLNVLGVVPGLSPVVFAAFMLVVFGILAVVNKLVDRTQISLFAAKNGREGFHGKTGLPWRALCWARY